MSWIKLFPTCIFYSQLIPNKKVIRDLVKETYQFRSIDSVGEKWSQKNYPFGYTSYSSINNLPFRSSEFAKVFKKIDRQVQSFSMAQEWNLAGRKLALESAWINIMGLGAHHSFHLHPLSVVSGTLFLQSPKESGHFKIEDPRLARMMAAPARQSSCRAEMKHHYSVEPKEGHLILFESHLRHEVSTHLAKTDRISISFNYHVVD